MSTTRFDLLTIFPEIFHSYLNESIIKRALEKNLIEIVVHDIRTYSKDRHHKVDGSPYGGGPGMVMMAQPIYDCIQAVRKLNSGPVIYLSPRGKMFNQRYAEKLVKKMLIPSVKKNGPNSTLTKPITNGKPRSGLILLCGRYEGIDQRVIDLAVDEELSIGKYILTGGELGALVVLDTISRLIPGVLGDDESSQEESFSKALKGKKEYPHFTRPEIFMDKKVPEILLSGHHAKIKAWRQENTL